MTYEKPWIGAIGQVASVVLGTSTSDDPDNGGDNGFPLDKPQDIAAGLDD
jgi:hypothetical protein